MKSTNAISPVCNFIAIKIGRKHTRALIDTGAHYSCLNADFAKQAQILVTNDMSIKLHRLMSANGVPLKVAGTASACISIAGYKHDVEFIVVSDLYHNVIFGIDSLHEMNAVIQGAAKKK